MTELSGRVGAPGVVVAIARCGAADLLGSGPCGVSGFLSVISPNFVWVGGDCGAALEYTTSLGPLGTLQTWQASLSFDGVIALAGGRALPLFVGGSLHDTGPAFMTPDQVGPAADLAAALEPFRLRALIDSALRWGLLSLAAWCLAMTVLLGWSKLSPTVHMVAWAAVLGALAVGSAVVGWALDRPDMLEVARVADARLDLGERLASAVSFGRSPGEMGSRLRADAVHHAQAHRAGGLPVPEAPTRGDGQRGCRRHGPGTGPGPQPAGRGPAASRRPERGPGAGQGGCGNGGKGAG